MCPQGTGISMSAGESISKCFEFCNKKTFLITLHYVCCLMTLYFIIIWNFIIIIQPLPNCQHIKINKAMSFKWLYCPIKGKPTITLNNWPIPQTANVAYKRLTCRNTSGSKKNNMYWSTDAAKLGKQSVIIQSHIKTCLELQQNPFVHIWAIPILKHFKGFKPAPCYVLNKIICRPKYICG